MRLIVLSALVACLILNPTCSEDVLTLNLTLETIPNQNNKPNKPKLDLTPTTILGNKTSTGSESKPNNVSTRLNLTPVGHADGTVYCKTKDNSVGICVLYYQCNSTTETTLNDGAGVLDTRRKNCPHYLQLCCGTIDIQKIEKEEDDYSDLDGLVGRRSGQAVTIHSGYITSKPVSTVAGSQKTASIPECGWNNPEVSTFGSRVKDVGKNRHTALAGDFPRMVALLKKSADGDVWSHAKYLGGGTLIHPSVVMTVAHKLQASRKINYSPTALYNDIALLILEKPFQLKNAPNIGTACIATSLPPTGSVCYSMGWGRIDPEKTNKHAHILKKVLLNIVEHNLCQEMLRNNTRLGPTFKLHESLMCASGSEEMDTCRGDGGSSLVCAVSNDPEKTQFTVHGLVAYSIECFNPNVPGQYANTLLLKSWVDRKMQEEGFDTKYYTM